MNGFRNVLIGGFIGSVVLRLPSAKDVGSRAIYRLSLRSDSYRLDSTRSRTVVKPRLVR
jgi:hypothetical protein